MSYDTSRSVRAWQKSNPWKVSARNAVQYALRTGKLTKQPCEACGSQRSAAHHDDYSKPLEVRWLCQKHHSRHHAAVGEAVNGAKPPDVARRTRDECRRGHKYTVENTSVNAKGTRRCRACQRIYAKVSYDRASEKSMDETGGLD